MHNFKIFFLKKIIEKNIQRLQKVLVLLNDLAKSSRDRISSTEKKSLNGVYKELKGIKTATIIHKKDGL